jgi:hypothetical protein
MLLQNIKRLYQKDEFSVFSKMGNLQQYSLEQFKTKVSSKFKFTQVTQDNIVIATCVDSNTELIVHYSLDGKFLKIFSETWIKSKIHFPRF